MRALLFLCLSAHLLSGASSPAQEFDRGVDDLAKRLGKEISKAGLGSVAVADFLNEDGSNSRHGFYLAEEFSQRLDHHKKNFVVLNRERLSSALSNAHLSTKDLTAADSLQRIRDALQVDGVVTGTVVIASSHYTVGVTVRSLKDGNIVASRNQSIKRPGYMDTLVFLDYGDSNERVVKAGVNGISLPACESCPIPTYTGKARAAKVQGDVRLLVVINRDGRVAKIAVTHSPDNSLASQAIEAVGKWKFKPATDKEGNAVAVIVPIEVTFRLY